MNANTLGSTVVLESLGTLVQQQHHSGVSNDSPSPFGPPLLLSIRDFKVELWSDQEDLGPLASNITLTNCILELYQATSSNN